MWAIISSYKTSPQPRFQAQSWVTVYQTHNHSRCTCAHITQTHTHKLLASSSELCLGGSWGGEGWRGTDVVQGWGPGSRREGIYDQTRLHPVYIFQDPSDQARDGQTDREEKKKRRRRNTINASRFVFREHAKLRSMCSPVPVPAPRCMMSFFRSFTLFPRPPTLLLALDPQRSQHPIIPPGCRFSSSSALMLQTGAA